MNLSHLFLTTLLTVSLPSCNGPGNAKTHSGIVTGPPNKQAVIDLDKRIWTIFQDFKGHYWFGSNGKGIFHFNGYILTQYTTEDGLISNQIRGIQEDREGDLFFETPAGISQFDGNSFTTLKPIPSENNTWALYPNDLWFHCNGNAADVYRYDGNNLYQLKLPRKDLAATMGIDPRELPYNPYAVFGINKDKKGSLWLGTVLAGAYRYNGNSFLWIGEKELSRQEDGREPGVRSILEDQAGNFWLSNFSSKYQITPSAYRKIPAMVHKHPFPNENLHFFNSGISDDKGNLWMTTYSQGLWKYDGESLSKVPIDTGLEEIFLICIFQDKAGRLWLGTDNAGVFRQEGKGFEKFVPVPSTPEK